MGATVVPTRLRVLFFLYILLLISSDFTDMMMRMRSHYVVRTFFPPMFCDFLDYEKILIKEKRKIEEAYSIYSTKIVLCVFNRDFCHSLKEQKTLYTNNRQRKV